MFYLWLSVFVICLMAESIKPRLVLIWFAFGAMIPMILSIFRQDMYLLQILIFVCVSLATLLATRPLVKKFFDNRKSDGKSDGSVGSEAVVVETIDNRQNSGTIKSGGILRSARSSDDTVIPENSLVVIERNDGSSVFVIKK